MIIFILLAGFSLISIPLIIVNRNLKINAKNFNENNSNNLENFDKLQCSDSAGLYHDDHAELHDYADQYVTWSFSTVPSQIINVWAMDAFQYSLWIAGQSASGYLLSTDSSDTGTFNVPEGNTWYIVFWNDEIGSEYTVVTYNANFVGDSRPPSITIYEPYGSYRAGQTLSIDWSSINAGNYVAIELYKGDTLHTTITASTSNDGYYEWTIPSDTTPGTDYNVKVSSLSTSAEALSSDFGIRGPHIFTILFPNYTSSLSMGNFYDIKFENSEYVHEINVSLLHNDKFTCYIETQRNNWGQWYEGHCPWIIPSDLTPSKNYSILICDYEDPNTNGISDYFEIAEHRGFNIINPTKLTKIEPNSIFTIRWNSTGDIDDIRIELWRDKHYEDNILISTEIILTITPNTPNEGSFLWNVPTLTKGNDYFIKIASITDSGCWELSDLFYIGPKKVSNNTILGYNIFILLSGISLISIAFITRCKRRIR